MPSGRRIPRPPADRPEKPPPPPEPEPGADAGRRSEVAKAGGELAALVADIRACAACGRSEEPRAFGSGFPRAPLMLLKDAPAPQDLVSGAAFTGEAEPIGKALGALGIPASWAYGTTAVRCGSGGASSDELGACAGHLLVEIEAVEPSVLVVFGQRAWEAVRALDGRCGLSVPDEPEPGEPVALRPGLVALPTEPLPAGVTERESKRRLWRDLQRLPGMLGRR